MSDETRRYILDVVRSLIRIGFVGLVLYIFVNSFDEGEAKIVAAYAAAETGLRGFDWTRKKTGDTKD